MDRRLLLLRLRVTPGNALAAAGSVAVADLGREPLLLIPDDPECLLEAEPHDRSELRRVDEVVGSRVGTYLSHLVFEPDRQRSLKASSSASRCSCTIWPVSSAASRRASVLISGRPARIA